MSESITLRRSGDLPLRFTGSLVAESSGHWCQAKEQNRWHDLTIYTSGKKWIAYVQYRTIWQGESDRDEIVEAGDLETLTIELRGIDPCAYVQGMPDHPQFREKQQRLLAGIRHRYEEQVGDVLLAAAQHDAKRQNICQCCGGELPPRGIWEANRHQADECDGSVDKRGRCRAFSRDELWEQTVLAVDSRIAAIAAERFPDRETVVCTEKDSANFLPDGEEAWFVYFGSEDSEPERIIVARADDDRGLDRGGE